MRSFFQHMDLAPQVSSGLGWEFFQVFFKARDTFLEIYNDYEDRVMTYATHRGVDRMVLRLSAPELSELLDFKKLEILRDDHLEPLRRISHQLFRTAESTDPLDRCVSEAFHEISILKEEQYKLLNFASSYRGAQIQSFLDEVHHAFPLRVHRVYDLFEASLHRLFELLPTPLFREDRIFLRSLYLYGEELLADHYLESLDDFWRKIFLPTGAPGGYLAIAQSFLQSGFRTRAYEAIVKAKEAGQQLQDGAEAPAMKAVLASIDTLCQTLEPNLSLKTLA